MGDKWIAAVLSSRRAIRRCGAGGAAAGDATRRDGGGSAAAVADAAHDGTRVRPQRRRKAAHDVGPGAGGSCPPRSPARLPGCAPRPTPGALPCWIIIASYSSHRCTLHACGIVEPLLCRRGARVRIPGGVAARAPMATTAAPHRRRKPVACIQEAHYTRSGCSC